LTCIISNAVTKTLDPMCSCFHSGLMTSLQRCMRTGSMAGFNGANRQGWARLFESGLVFAASKHEIHWSEILWSCCSLVQLFLWILLICYNKC